MDGRALMSCINEKEIKKPYKEEYDINFHYED